jgi:hypothetical protein
MSLDVIENTNCYGFLDIQLAPVVGQSDASVLSPLLLPECIIGTHSSHRKHH